MAKGKRTQDHRNLAIETPLGKDALLILSMRGSEGLGRLFKYEIEMFSEVEAIDETKVLGKSVTVRVDAKNGDRYFNGVISQITLTSVGEEDGNGSQLFFYHATMVPWFWFFTRWSNCRIFQNESVPEIIKKVMKERGYSDIKDDLTETYRTWEYCVQYRETDFNFISRLMENEGIYYYFKMENGKHTMMLCDGPGDHKSVDGYKTLEFDKPEVGEDEDAYIWGWTKAREVTPNAVAFAEYDPVHPTVDLAKNRKDAYEGFPSTMELFDYPGGYVTGGEGDFYKRTRLEEAAASHVTARGTSSARGVFAGAKFTLKGHPTANDDYLVTSVSYALQNDDMGTGRGGEGPKFQSQLKMIPWKVPFRPARITPKPVVQGSQTAIVAGPAGEEIYTDPKGLGRVMVQFHWDRDSKGDEKSSCWIRVSQPWAGKNWGMFFIPRIGQEVVVSFLEGDPDRPLITGSVYNGKEMPPYALPEKKTMSTMKSNSTKGGQGFNEMRFEDKKGEEQLFMHAQKNLDIHVKNDRHETIEKDRHLTVNRNKFEKVNGNRHEDVKKSHQEEIKESFHLKVGTESVTKIGGTMSREVGGSVVEKVHKNQTVEVAEDYFVKAKNIVIEATERLTIHVGNNYIAIDKSSISIGCEEGGATAELSAVAGVKVDSPAEVTIQGAMVKIN